MNLLFTSVGRRAYLLRYFRKAMGEHGKIYAVNSAPMSTGMAQADESFVSPVIYDKEYIPFLIKLCKEKAIDMLIPLFDIDLPVLSSAKPQFEKTFVAVSDSGFIDSCNDKLKMNEFLISAGLKTVPVFTRCKGSIQEIVYGKDGILNDIIPICKGMERVQELEYYFRDKFKKGIKFMIKPRWGMGSLGIYEAGDFDELEFFYNKTYKDIYASYLKYEAGNNIESAVIIQEKIIGREYGIDIINDFKGNFITAVIKEKIAMRAGETDISKVVMHPKLYEIARIIALKGRHIGNLDIDIILNEDGAYVIDMNARFGGGYPFSHAAGIDLPKAMLAWLMGREAEPGCFIAEADRVYAKDIELMRLG